MRTRREKSIVADMQMSFFSSGFDVNAKAAAAVRFVDADGSERTSGERRFRRNDSR